MSEPIIIINGSKVNYASYEITRSVYSTSDRLFRLAGESTPDCISITTPSGAFFQACGALQSGKMVDGTPIFVMIGE